MSTQPLPQLPPPREPLIVNGRPTRRALRILALTPPLVAVALLIGGGIGWAGGSWLKTHQIEAEPAGATTLQDHDAAAGEPGKDDETAVERRSEDQEASQDDPAQTAQDRQSDDRKREKPTEQATAQATEEPTEEPTQEATESPEQDPAEQPSDEPDAQSSPAAEDGASGDEGTSDTSDDGESSTTTSGTQSTTDDGGTGETHSGDDGGSADAQATGES